MTFQSSTLTTDTDVEDAEQTQATLDKAASLRSDAETVERPDWLPEGFESVEDFVADYEKLKQGGTADEDTPEGADDGELDAEADEGEGDQPEATDGIDFASLHAEYFEQGGLSDESFEALEAAGIPRSYVEHYIRGYEAQTQLAEMQAAEVAGGSENLNAILQWAGQTLPDREIARINQMVEAGDMEGYLTNLHGLKARYEAANGSLDAPALIGGNGAIASDVYQSADEMKADMRDPRYARDEAFRAQVAAKVARTRRVAG